MRKGVLAAAAVLALTAQVAAEPMPAPRMLAAQSKLGFDLIDLLAKDRSPGRNVVISPASLAAALATLDVGADARMRAALHASIGFTAGTDAVADLAALRDAVGSVGKISDDKATGVSMANAIILDPSTSPNQATLAKLRASGVEVTVDSLTPAVIKKINDWVSRQTRGLIPTVLGPPPPPPGLVVINALYFKGLWPVPFDKAATRPMPFHDVAGGSAEVPMMARTATRRFRQDGRFVAVELPYKDDRFALVVVTTKDRPAAAGEFSSIAGWLGGDGFGTALVALSLPRFTIEESAELLPAADAMGLKDGRASPTALAAFAARRVDISSISQRTYMRVDEEGTEAAAVTVIIAPTAAMRREPDPEKMVVDKPFVFALRDKTTGLVLMMGYVGRPTPVATASKVP